MKKVMISGCYDILHGGHVEFFHQAKALGDYLIVSFASDNVLLQIKKRKSSIPQEHKKRLIESLEMVDEVVIGNSTENEGLDFIEHFYNLKPNILAATEDDRYREKKIELCKNCGWECEYISLPKTLNFEAISTTEIIKWIQAPKEVPLRVDFAGGWLDVPKYSIEDGYIVNCTISPVVTLNEWKYNIGGGLGGSAAYSILSGRNGVESELNLGVGWQDPAVIMETGLCCWRSGHRPILHIKRNPDMLQGKMALLWTGKNHNTPSNVDNKRYYEGIKIASEWGYSAIVNNDYTRLCTAVLMSYKNQLQEGMEELPTFNEKEKKYCGGGHGGYALYMFTNEKERNKFLLNDNTLLIEPYIRTI